MQELVDGARRRGALGAREQVLAAEPRLDDDGAGELPGVDPAFEETTPAARVEQRPADLAREAVGAGILIPHEREAVDEERAPHRAGIRGLHREVGARAQADDIDHTRAQLPYGIDGEDGIGHGVHAVHRLEVGARRAHAVAVADIAHIHAQRRHALRGEGAGGLGPQAVGPRSAHPAGVVEDGPGGARPRPAGGLAHHAAELPGSAGHHERAFEDAPGERERGGPAAVFDRAGCPLRKEPHHGLPHRRREPRSVGVLEEVAEAAVRRLGHRGPVRRQRGQQLGRRRRPFAREHQRAAQLRVGAGNHRLQRRHRGRPHHEPARLHRPGRQGRRIRGRRPERLRRHAVEGPLLPQERPTRRRRAPQDELIEAAGLHREEPARTHADHPDRGVPRLAERPQRRADRLQPAEGQVLVERAPGAVAEARPVEAQGVEARLGERVGEDAQRAVGRRVLVAERR